MTLIEIIKTSLLGFSAIFVLLWIFFYLFLKFKKSKNQAEQENQPVPQPVQRINQRPMPAPSPVYVQQVIYPSVYRMNQGAALAENHRNYLHKENYRAEHRPRFSNKPEKFVVFNNRQYGLYNV